MVVVFLLEIYAGIVGDLLKNATEETLTGTMQATMQQYGKDFESTVLWDDIHGNVSSAPCLYLIYYNS